MRSEHGSEIRVCRLPGKVGNVDALPQGAGRRLPRLVPAGRCPIVPAPLGARTIRTIPLVARLPGTNPITLMSFSVNALVLLDMIPIVMEAMVVGAN